MNNEFIVKDSILIKYKGTKQDVKIPDEVTSIGEKAFKDCDFYQALKFQTV